jgi:hypothetical protein
MMKRTHERLDSLQWIGLTASFELKAKGSDKLKNNKPATNCDKILNYGMNEMRRVGFSNVCFTVVDP